MQSKVLVQKTYVIGHYVTVDAKGTEAMEKVRQALIGDQRLEGFEDLYDRIESDYEEIESEIDEWFKDGDFVLNSPPVGGSPNVAGIELASSEEWGRPLVIEIKPLLVEKGGA